MGRAISWRDFAALSKGAVGGGVGTAAFTGWMKGAQRVAHVAHVRHPPQRMVTPKVREPEKPTAALSPPPRKTVDLETAVSHLGFGVATGALFGVLSRRLHPRIPGAVQGAAWGSLVWAASNFGLVPKLELDLLPNAEERDKNVLLFFGHLIFGGLLGAIAGRKER